MHRVIIDQQQIRFGATASALNTDVGLGLSPADADEIEIRQVEVTDLAATGILSFNGAEQVRIGGSGADHTINAPPVTVRGGERTRGYKFQTSGTSAWLFTAYKLAVLALMLACSTAQAERIMRGYATPSELATQTSGAPNGTVAYVVSTASWYVKTAGIWGLLLSAQGGSSYGYESFTSNTTLTSASKRHQSCENPFSGTTPTSISVTMPDCGTATDGFEYVIAHPVNANAGACAILPGAGDTIDVHAAWVLTTQNESVTLVCNAASNTWKIRDYTENLSLANSWAWRIPTAGATAFIATGNVLPSTPAFSSSMGGGGIGPRASVGTAATTGTYVEIASSSNDVAEMLLSPRAVATVGMNTAVAASYRFWAAAFVGATQSASNTLTGTGAGIVASTSGDPQWQCCTHDGTTASCVDIGSLNIPATTNTIHFRVTLQTAFNLGVACTVQIITNPDGTAGTSASVWKTTNIDAAGTTDLGIYTSLTTLANATKTLMYDSMQVRVGR